MDPNPISTSAAAAAPTPTDDADDDCWDTEGFVVPTVLTGNTGNDAGGNSPKVVSAASANLATTEANSKREDVQLETEGLSSSNYSEHRQNLSSVGLDNSTTLSGTSRKQKLKHKLREADKKFNGRNDGRENKIESLREIMGGGNQMNNTHAAKKGSSRDWLDPHCNESEFDRRSN